MEGFSIRIILQTSPLRVLTRCTVQLLDSLEYVITLCSVSVDCRLCVMLPVSFAEVSGSTPSLATCSKWTPMEIFWCVCTDSSSSKSKLVRHLRLSRYNRTMPAVTR